MSKIIPVILLFSSSVFAGPCEMLTQYMPKQLIKDSICLDGLLMSQKDRVKIAIQYISPLSNYELPFHRNYVDTSAETELLTDVAKDTGLDVANLASEKIDTNDPQSRFSLENLTLMSPSLNRKGGTWSNLEVHEIALAKKLGGIISISGSVSANELPHNDFFKILVQPNIESSISFLIKHEGDEIDMEKLITSIDCIEKFANIDFALPGIENSEESTSAFSLTLFSNGGRSSVCEERI